MNERIKELLLEAKIYDGSATQDIITCPEDLEKFADLVRADEREACAKVVEIEAMQYAEPVWAFEIVNDIRARGNT